MKKRSRNIDWSLVDLTRPASDLASELGVHVQAVYAARKRLGIEAENLAGGHREGAGAKIGNQNRKGKTLPDAMTQYQLRIPPALLEAVKAEAKRTKNTASEVIRLAIVSHLNRTAPHGTEEAQKPLDS